MLILLFGATRLPQTAKGLGQSLRVFRKELRDDDPTPTALPTIAQDQGSTTQSNPDSAAAPNLSDSVKHDQV